MVCDKAYFYEADGTHIEMKIRCQRTVSVVGQASVGTFTSLSYLDCFGIGFRRIYTLFQRLLVCPDGTSDVLQDPQYSPYVSPLICPVSQTFKYILSMTVFFPIQAALRSTSKTYPQNSHCVQGPLPKGKRLDRQGKSQAPCCCVSYFVSVCNLELFCKHSMA